MKTIGNIFRMNLFLIPPQFQSAFEKHLAEERIRSTKEIGVLASVLYVTFGILDVWAIPSALTAVWLVRLAVVFFMLSVVALTRTPLFLKHYAPIKIVFFLIMGLGIEMMVYLAGPQDLAKHTYYTGLILVVMALYTWSFLPIWQITALGASMVALYVLIALKAHGMSSETEWTVLVTNCFFFVSANIIGVFAAIQRNRYLRDSFLLRENLISDLERTESEKRQNEFWAEHDPLTGLPNRKYLMAMLAKAVEDAKTTHATVAVLFIDLDGFKSINDNLGHAVGDAVLNVIGQRLVRNVREHDLFARLGGDEFIVVLPLNGAHREVATRIAGAIIASVEHPIHDPDIGIKLSASIGIAFFPDHAHSADALVKIADGQMYESKRRGKGKITIAPVTPATS